MPNLTVSQIAQLCGASLEGPPEVEISGPAPLEEARPGQVTFLGDPRYREALTHTRASAVVLAPEMECERKDLVLLRCAKPSEAFTKVVQAFAPPASHVPRGIHPSAVVHGSAKLDDSVAVGPFCHVDEGAILESGVVLVSHVTVGAGARVAKDTVLHPQVTLYPWVQVGERCRLHSGVVIGAHGFGFAPTADGWAKIPQVGGVILEDDVEVGANSTIDCARFGNTVIGRGSKIDNLVHVAHNSQVGEASLLLAQSGVAGSTQLGERVILAGQSGVGGHLKLGAGVRVGAGSKVLKSVADGQDVFGAPAGPKQETLRAMAFLPKLRAELSKLKARLKALEENS
ncbi:MAG: UDP-3-O-(3-hydroxymyristoyl)glucosamine N-acyltransferase [Planctomycetota bacterium]|nr:UDP-3-O-(3-hydroxymyristoyl)glucosamine N-acyltransferase [Planctomycetota bacterium]